MKLKIKSNQKSKLKSFKGALKAKGLKCRTVPSYSYSRGGKLVVVPAHERCYSKTKAGKVPSRSKKGVSNPTREVIDEDVDLEAKIAEAKKAKKGTLEMYENDAERELLRNEIEQKFFEGREPGEKKVIYMMGGAPANGKSTYLESDVSEVPLDSAMAIDSDQIKQSIPEYGYLQKKKDMEAAAFVHEESSMLSKRVLSRAIDEGHEAILDGVGDGSYEKLKGKVSDMKRNGHQVVANYVSLDADLSLKLALSRAKKTGRMVPAKYIKDTNRDISRIVTKALEEKLFDKFSLWDTNQQGNPRQVIEFADGKVVSVNKELWSRFLAKGGSANVKKYNDLFD